MKMRAGSLLWVAFCKADRSLLGGLHAADGYLGHAVSGALQTGARPAEARREVLADCCREVALRVLVSCASAGAVSLSTGACPVCGGRWLLEVTHGNTTCWWFPA